MALIIRRARPDEAGLVLSLVRELAEYEKLLHEVEATEAMIAVALFAGNPRLFCDIAEWNGEPAGLAVWPAFTGAVTPQAKGGAVAADIGTVAGPGGTRQVTYNGHPLYYYVGDHQPGSTAGQGLNQFGALWYVLSGSGAANTSAPSSPAPAAPSGSGNSYGY